MDKILISIIFIYIIFTLCLKVKYIYNKIIFLILLLYIACYDIKYALFFILFYFTLNSNWKNINIEGLENENDSSLISSIIDYYYKNINQKTDIIKVHPSLSIISNDKIPLQIFQMWHSSELLPKMKEARNILIERTQNLDLNYSMKKNVLRL